MENMEQLQEMFERIVREFRYVHADDIPDIDLYMDQVTTFMDQHLASCTRNPEKDKILTKTMINNYAKNDLLLPPVKKKYGKDHMILLLLIFFLKSSLSIGDIEEVLRPVRDHYTKQGRERAAQAQHREKHKATPEEKAQGRERALDAGEDHLRGEDKERRQQNEEAAKTREDPELQDIYDEICRGLEQQLERIRKEADEDFQAAGAAFAEYPAEDRDRLQRFDLILRMSAEIYLRKLFIERMLDEEKKS